MHWPEAGGCARVSSCAQYWWYAPTKRIGPNESPWATPLGNRKSLHSRSTCTQVVSLRCLSTNARARVPCGVRVASVACTSSVATRSNACLRSPKKHAYDCPRRRALAIMVPSHIRGPRIERPGKAPCSVGFHPLRQALQRLACTAWFLIPHVPLRRNYRGGRWCVVGATDTE